MERILSAGKRFSQVSEKAQQMPFLWQYLTLPLEILKPLLDIDDSLF